MAAQPYKILLVDDDICAMGLKRAMRRLELPNTFYIANDGIEALELLRGNDNASPVETPYLVLLDLDMPRMSGHEFLREGRNDPSLSKTVIFVLTTSAAETDKLSAYDKNIAGYIVKSDAEQTFLNVLGMLEHYCKVVELPC